MSHELLRETPSQTAGPYVHIGLALAAAGCDMAVVEEWLGNPVVEVGGVSVGIGEVGVDGGFGRRCVLVVSVVWVEFWVFDVNLVVTESDVDRLSVVETLCGVLRRAGSRVPAVIVARVFSGDGHHRERSQPLAGGGASSNPIAQ